MPDAATDITEIKPTQPRSAEAASMHRRGSARQCAWGENREGADVPEQIGSNRDSTQPRRSCQALCLGRPWHIDRNAMSCDIARHQLGSRTVTIDRSVHERNPRRALDAASSEPRVLDATFAQHIGDTPRSSVIVSFLSAHVRRVGFQR